MPQWQWRINSIVWLVLAASLILDCWGLRRAGLTLRLAYLPQFAFLLASGCGSALFCRFVERDDHAALFGHAICQLFIASFLIDTAQYGLQTFRFPYIDASLLRADAALGFDWRAYVGWAEDKPRLALLFSVTYQSFVVVLVLVMCLLFLGRHSAHGQRVVIAYFLAGLVSLGVAARFPSTGGYIYYQLDMHHLGCLNPTVGRGHEAALTALRAHAMSEVSFPAIGLVNFPSFHTVIALLLIYGALPLRRARWVIIPLNILMLFAIPIEGAHYLVDVLSGLGLALLALYAAERALPRSAISPA